MFCAEGLKNGMVYMVKLYVVCLQWYHSKFNKGRKSKNVRSYLSSQASRPANKDASFIRTSDILSYILKLTSTVNPVNVNVNLMDSSAGMSYV